MGRGVTGKSGQAVKWLWKSRFHAELDLAGLWIKYVIICDFTGVARLFIDI